MSNKKKVNRKRRRSPWFKMFAKTETRLSAHVTCEDDWQTDVPNIRLSRAFVIVLLMHLVVGGALIAFTLMNPNEANAQGEPAAAEKKPGNEASTEAAIKKPSAGEQSSPQVEAKPDTRPDDMRRHIVHSGDSVGKIARQYGVTAEQIHAVNRIDDLYQLYQGRVLRIPVSVSTPVPLNSRIAETPSTNGSNAVSSEPSRLPVTIPRATIPRATIPDTIDIAANSEHQAIDHSLMHPEEQTSRPVVEEESSTPPVAVPVETPASPPAAVAVEAPAAQPVAARPPARLQPSQQSSVRKRSPSLPGRQPLARPRNRRLTKSRKVTTRSGSLRNMASTTMSC